MSLELIYLLCSVGLGAVYLNTQAAVLRHQMGIIDANGPRDHDPKPDLMTGRGERALRNFYETFPLFAALVVIVELSGTHDGLTAWGCHLYFWGRVAYLPLIMLGLAPWRSIAWTIAAIGLILLFVGILV